MHLPLPYGDMEWEEPKRSVEDLTYERTEPFQDVYDQQGRLKIYKKFVYEVDLEYPVEIHEKTKYFPLAPHKVKVNHDMLSPYQQSLKPSNTFTEKLMLTHLDKNKYIVLGDALDFYLDQGMILKKIYRKLVIKTKCWLRSYVDFNIQQRTKAKQNKDDIGIELFKLLNNSFYGKTIGNPRKRQNVKIVNNAKDHQLLTSKITFKYSKIFTEDVIAIRMLQSSIMCDKFNFIGFTILEYAKLVMYNFVYNGLDLYLHGKYKIHYCDTDSTFIEFILDKNETLNDIMEKI